MVGEESADWKRCFYDPWFYLALAAGPLVWCGLLLTGVATGIGLPAISLLVLGVLVYPILEEIVFRGALQGWLLEHSVLSQSLLPGISYANLLASLVFSLFHFISQPPLWAALVFFPSIIFGWSRDRFGSLPGSIILHAFYNAGFLLLIFR